MKKLSLIMAVLTAMTVSCKKASGPDGTTDIRPTSLTINVCGNSTKSTVDDTANEAKLNNVQCFVFKGDVIDGYGKSTGSASVSVEATCGVRDIYVFVNAPDLSAYISKTALLDATSSLTADNNSSNFVMMGKAAAVTVTTNYSRTINVDRYAARVKIGQIVNDFSNEALKAKTFKVTRVYLTSVVDKVKYNLGAASAPGWLSAEFAGNGAISTGNVLLTSTNYTSGSSLSFYCYPNSTVSETSGACPTRLVVECKVGDQFYTYPIPLGGLDTDGQMKDSAIENNHSYEITKLTLKRLGNLSDGDNVVDDGENDPVKGSDVAISIVVKDWEQILVGNSGEVII